MAFSILVADDDPLLCALVEYKFTTAGYKVLTTTDGDSALKLARSERPDVMLIDAMMPGPDGFDVLRTVRNDPSLKSIPVILLTARRLEEEIVTAFRLGAADYITKPFMPEVLLARVDRVLAVNQST